MNEMVEAANWPWWLTDREVLVGSQRAIAASGTRAPEGAIRYRSSRARGLCRYCGATSMTTWYWLSAE